MPVIVRVTSAEGDVFFEAEPTAADLVEIGVFDKATDVVKDAAVTSETLVSTLRRCTHDVVSAVDSIAGESTGRAMLKSVELEIGVKLTAAGNVIVAKGTAEANLKVVLSWDFT